MTQNDKRMIHNPEHAKAIRAGEFAHVPNTLGRLGDCHAWIVRNGNVPNAHWKFRYRYSYAIPTQKAIAAIAEHSSNGIIEMGAGLGYWSHLLRLADVDVEAYDIEPNITHNRYFAVLPDVPATPWTAIEHGTPDILAIANPKKTLFLCWPDVDNFASQTLAAYPGDTLAYVGETIQINRSTADDRFHAELDAKWHVIEEVEIPQLKHCTDNLRIYRRIQH